MNVLDQAALMHELYDKLGTKQHGWDGRPYNYNYSSALIEIVNYYARPEGKESPANFAKKNALAGKFAAYVAAHLKEARAAGISDATFFKSKSISEQYQDQILTVADMRGGKRSGKSRLARTRRLKPKRYY